MHDKSKALLWDAADSARYAIAFIEGQSRDEFIKDMRNIAAVERMLEKLKKVIALGKTATLYARIEPDVKEQAESILGALGIPASNAINMFYKQVILQKGLPFEVKLPQHPLDISGMSPQQLNQELEAGFQEAQADNTVTLEEAFGRFERGEE